MTGLATKGQWDRPLADRIRDDLTSEARTAALHGATEAELRELGTRLACADHLRQNGDQYAGHLARLDALKPTHLNGLASIRGQAEDAEAEVAAWWSDRAPEPTEAEVEARRAALLTSGLFDVDPDLPTVAAPSDGLGVAAGLRFLGETRGRLHPDGTVRRPPCALFLDVTDLTLWVRNAKGEICGYTGLPPGEILATRAEE